MTNSTSSYDQLLRELKETALLASTASVLHWDEQTYMPTGGGTLRADQVSLIARLCHERMTSEKFAELLAGAEEEVATHKDDGGNLSDAAVNLREIRRDYDRESRLPASFVEEESRTCSLSEQAWAQARKSNSFVDFKPWLEKVLDLKKREVEYVGYPSGEPYDALLDTYEPEMTAGQLRGVFQELRDSLAEIVAAVKNSGRTAPSHILHRNYAPASQEKLARLAAGAIGFDFEQGRLDTSVHPFCSLIGPGDTRMTTRYIEDYIGDGFFSVLHESGHGLYDQGLPVEQFGTPLGDYVSLGIHESQSRMWENLVGRGEAFWQWMWPKFRDEFADQLKDVSQEEWMFAINGVQPSFIRTESDEVTYNLHIILRFELEQALLGGEISAADLPGEWNSAMGKLLGIKPDSDANGCLQDVHWSGGGFGYFPTYTLGNLISAQLFEAAQTEMPGLENEFAAGRFDSLLGWLRSNVHQCGKRYSSSELVQRATGKELSAQPLLKHLRAKTQLYYGV